MFIGRPPHVFAPVDHPATAHLSLGSVVAFFGEPVFTLAPPTPSEIVSVTDPDAKLISRLDVHGTIVSIVALPDAVGFPGSVRV